VSGGPGSPCSDRERCLSRVGQASWRV